MILPAALTDDVRRWRYRTDWRGRLVLQVREERTTTAPGSAAPIAIESQWRDAGVEDLAEWGGAAATLHSRRNRTPTVEVTP